MKQMFRSGLLTASMCVLALLASTTQTVAQDYTPDPQTVVKEVFTKPFPTVWKAISKILADRNCALENNKYTQDEKTEMYRGNIRSEACVLVSGEDSTRDVMMRIGKVPMIRGGVWVAGRIQYNFSVKDIGNKQVQVVLTAEVSGNEDFITHKVHFWYSNGEPEWNLMNALRKELGMEEKPMPKKVEDDD